MIPAQTGQKCGVCGLVHGPGEHGEHTHPEMVEQLSNIIAGIAAASDHKYAAVLQQLHAVGRKLIELGESMTKIQV